MPENKLKHNDPKTLEFTIHVDPDYDATFPGDSESLETYLKQVAIDKFPLNLYTGYALTAISFTIDTSGQVTGAKTFWPCGHSEVDSLLLSTIQNMPTWAPATYANGSKIAQDYVLLVGNMNNCVLGMLPLER